MASISSFSRFFSTDSISMREFVFYFDLFDTFDGDFSGETGVFCLYTFNSYRFSFCEASFYD